MREKFGDLLKKLKSLFLSIKNRSKKLLADVRFRKAMRITAMVTGILLCLILIPIFIFNSVLIIKGYVNEDEVPSIFGISPLIVESGSMETTIMTGDLVFVKKADTDTLKVNDIIAYKENSYVVTHRIVEITVSESGEKRFVTKGDNNNIRDDKPVKEDAVIGLYIGRVGKIGDLAMFLKTPAGLIVFVGLPFIAIVVYDILRRNLINKKQKAEAPAEEIKNENEELKAEIARLKALAEKNDKEDSPQ